MQTITLNGKKELDIYINPQRQRLLREMTVIGEPVTPKQLSDALGISPSAVQHHIARLVELGVVGLSHTKRIRGITAHFYKALPVTVSIGALPDTEDAPQRLAIIQSGVNAVLTGFLKYIATAENRAAQTPPPGDVLWGISRLRPGEARELFAVIRRFIAEHEATDQNTERGAIDQNAEHGAIDQNAEHDVTGINAEHQTSALIAEHDIIGINAEHDVTDQNAEHEATEQNTEPWEYALIAYPAMRETHA